MDEAQQGQFRWATIDLATFDERYVRAVTKIDGTRDLIGLEPPV